MSLIKPGDVISTPEAPSMVVTWADDTEIRAESVIRINGRLLTKKLVGTTESVEESINYLWRENEFAVMRVGSNHCLEWYLLKEKCKGIEKTLAKAIEMAYHTLNNIDKKVNNNE